MIVSICGFRIAFLVFLEPLLKYLRIERITQAEVRSAPPRELAVVPILFVGLYGSA